MHQWSTQLSGEHIIMYLHKPHASKLTQQCDRVCAAKCVPISDLFCSWNWCLASLVPFNEPLINAADKWCGKNGGYTHHGSGERINPITSKGMDLPKESCSSSPYLDSTARQTSVGQGRVCWWDWTILILINRGLNWRVCPLQMKKHI